MKHLLRLALVWVWAQTACTQEDFVKPDFLKIYLFENSYLYNQLSYAAFVTPDNGYLLFAVQGNLQTIYDRVNTLVVLRLDENGELLWRKAWQQDDYGFPSNIVEVDNGFDLFWSQEDEIQELNFRYHPNDTMQLSKRTVGCSFTQYNCSKAYEIVPTLGNGPYMYLNYGQNGPVFYTFVANADVAQQNIVGQYITDPKELFPNIDQYNPATRFSANFWIEQNAGRYYLNVPYSNSFSLLQLGNEQPIYSDKYYWIGSHLFYGADEMAAIVSPNNLRSEEGKVYFVPSISLRHINQNYAELDTKIELAGLDDYFPISILLHESVFYVAGTTFSGSTALFLISEEGELLAQHSFGQVNNYQISSMRLSQSGSHLALFGTTKVNGSIQRAYFLKVPLNELR